MKKEPVLYYDSDYGILTIPYGLYQEARRMNNGVELFYTRCVCQDSPEQADGSCISAWFSQGRERGIGGTFLRDVMDYIGKWKFDHNEPAFTTPPDLSEITLV